MQPEFTALPPNKVEKPVYTDATLTLFCEVYGHPDVEIQLTRNGVIVSAEDFEREEYDVQEPWKYDIEKGFGLRMTWKLSAPFTCDNVDRYDSSNYQFVATIGHPDGPVHSEEFAIETQCTISLYATLNIIFFKRMEYMYFFKLCFHLCCCCCCCCFRCSITKVFR